MTNRRELFRLTSAAIVPRLFRAAAPRTKRRLLYFTGSAGFTHSVVKRNGMPLSHSENLLTEMGRRSGFDVDCTKDGRVFDRDLDSYDGIAFYTTGDLTQATEGNPQPMTLAGKQKLLEAVAAGKGFVGFHSATDTFHSKAEIDPYIAMIGGEFLGHGQQQEASLAVASHFPSVANLGVGESLSLYDEWYAMKNYASDLHVVLVQETKMMSGSEYRRPDFPATWARMHGKGRVFYTSLGHREDIWTNGFFQAIALGGIDWATRKVDFDVKPNLAELTPQANQWRG
jgi:type 1 glutamine amidotransferase